MNSLLKSASDYINGNADLPKFIINLNFLEKVLIGKNGVFENWLLKSKDLGLPLNLRPLVMILQKELFEKGFTPDFYDEFLRFMLELQKLYQEKSQVFLEASEVIKLIHIFYPHIACNEIPELRSLNLSPKESQLLGQIIRRGIYAHDWEEAYNQNKRNLSSMVKEEYTVPKNDDIFFPMMKESSDDKSFNLSSQHFFINLRDKLKEVNWDLTVERNGNGNIVLRNLRDYISEFEDPQ